MENLNIDKESATEDITGNIKKTYRSMFNAHNRLLATYYLQKFSTISIAIYILAISIIILNNQYFSSEKTNIFNIYLTILSIISLTLSLTIGESGNKELAERFQLCARELQRLYNSIQLKLELDNNYKLTEEEIKKYNNTFKKYGLRQQLIDYEYYKHEKYKKNNISYISVILFHIKYFLFTKFIYILLLVLPLIGLALILFINI